MLRYPYTLRGKAFMIYTNLKDVTASLMKKNKTFKMVLDFLDDKDLINKENGKYDLDDGVFALVQSYDTKPEKEGRWESHQAYIDVQFIVSGDELDLTTNKDNLTLDEDKLKENDALFYKKFYEPVTKMHLTTGDVCVFFAEDAHEPGLNLDGTVPIKKVVVKIPKDLILN